MKKVITFSVFCLVFIACHNNSNHSNATSADSTLGLVENCCWKDFNLQGKVKKITEYNYEVEIDDNNNVKRGALVADYEPIVVKEFTPEGLLARVANYQKEGEVPVLESLYEYDAQNRLISIKIKDADSESTDRYEYSADGYPTACISTYKNNKENMEDKTTYSYELTLTPDGKKVVERNSNSYDPKSYTVKYYNKQNLLVKECFYVGEDPMPQSESVYTYDGKNLCERIEQRTSEKGNPPTISLFFYDKYGNITKSTFDTPAGIEYDEDHRENTNEYVYDNKGNIVQSTIINDENPSIRVYKIEYY